MICSQYGVNVRLYDITAQNSSSQALIILINLWQGGLDNDRLVLQQTQNPQMAMFGYTIADAASVGSISHGYKDILSRVRELSPLV